MPRDVFLERVDLIPDFEVGLRKKEESEGRVSTPRKHVSSLPLNPWNEADLKRTIKAIESDAPVVSTEDPLE